MNAKHSQSEKPFVVVITGLSGAGLSTAIKALEDNGFYCIDNLPIELIEQVVEFIGSGRQPVAGYALGMDIREKGFAEQFPKLISHLQQKCQLDVVFLRAESEIIANRYSTTRRRHPLMSSDLKLTDAIEKERALLEPVEHAANAVFDTSIWSPHHLARMLEHRYHDEVPQRNLYVSLTSFGFKNGLLSPVDTLFDVRMLNNPYFIPRLRNMTGLDTEIQEFILGDKNSRSLLEELSRYLAFVLPLYYQEGKHYFRIGIGCTGGQHRSVFFAEALVAELQKKKLKNIVLTALHRDIPKITPAQR